MSLEAALVTLTEAVQAQTALIEKSLAAAAAKTNGKAVDAKPPTAAKPGKTRATTAKKPKAFTEEDVKKGYGAYFSNAASKPERARLAATVAPICAHFGVERISLCSEDQRAEAMRFLEKLNAAFEEGGVEACEALDLGLSNEGDDDDEEDDDEDDL